ncbi:hypothetical protein THAOC_18097 [Thalassiosira oceanica]|uniref:Uncharacterized protein n=1 Tax=Thalassiosira oceanica TaxID=159749 RepID=K0SK88_THAOC|nr:hypothetical protein THAOC_18097 [Thalassiosira oceanica]|eukprot:EJK61421.1 hypothetical protein THAOC_18097 [Thalassiosira oceanica]
MQAKLYLIRPIIRGCWLTIPERMEEEVKQFLADNGLPWQTTQGKRHVGGFIGSEDALSAWIEPKVENWTFAIERASAAVRYPQTAYTGLARSLQCEWQYICRVVEGAERYLEPLEKAIREEFLPALLGVDKAEIGDDLLTQPDRIQCEKRGPGHPEPGLTRRQPESEGSPRVRATGQQSAKTARLATEKASLEEMKGRATRRDKKRLERISETGAFLTVRPSRRDGTELERDEFRDAVLLRMEGGENGESRENQGSADYNSTSQAGALARRDQPPRAAAAEVGRATSLPPRGARTSSARAGAEAAAVWASSPIKSSGGSDRLQRQVDDLHSPLAAAAARLYARRLWRFPRSRQNKTAPSLGQVAYGCHVYAKQGAWKRQPGLSPRATSGASRRLVERHARWLLPGPLPSVQVGGQARNCTQSSTRVQRQRSRSPRARSEGSAAGTESTGTAWPRRANKQVSNRRSRHGPVESEIEARSESASDDTKEENDEGEDEEDKESPNEEEDDEASL